MMQVEATIKELRPRNRNKIIEAKVYRSWIARDPPGTTEKDYIGCYISSGQADTIGDPNRDQMVIRKVEIQNLNRNSIELTLWDDLADKFEKDQIDALEKPVIIAVSSCKVSRYRNQLQLSSTPATYYINPRIPHLQDYRAEYKELFNLNPPLEIVRQPYEDKEQEKLRNRFALSVLLHQIPKTYEGVWFTCEGTVTSINASRDWYYPSCTTCSLKAEYNDGIFECKVHGPLEYPSYRYNFKANLTENTATSTIMFFTPKANDIVGIDCNSLVASLTNPDPRDIPEKIQQVVGKTHIFQFQYNTSSKQGSGTMQEPCEKINKDIPQQTQPLAAITYIPTPAESTNIQATPVTATQEQRDTPPALEDTLAKQSSKGSAADTTKLTSAK
ncbi:replication protein A 70 kDa DNA-binding subunit [Artemisia annua]|uniref:Replication protein A 70 kDa DNA-binding subunit n=1 Tax=Artemisia annua TaxID=35608 RepID=A0A2U1LRH1_ARTAN|nr:replication protein A 70 kDa DNA-binding subunit [Artemisia annua]